MRKAFKYRVYPTKAQAVKLESWIDLCRELHNAAIEERRDSWRGAGISVSFYDQCKQLPEIKKERPELAEVYSQILQQALHRVDSAFQHFFRRVKSGETPGYPRFMARDRYNSLTWPQKGGFALVGTKRLRLGSFGEVKIKLHRQVEGETKTCTIKREAGNWYAIFSCDNVPARAYPDTTSEIGIDMGLTTYAALTTGEKVDNPRWYRKTESRLKDAQRELSKKKRGSKRRQKAKNHLARLSEKTSNQRKDFQHKLAHRIVSENSLISVEDLSVKKMIKKSSTGLSKSIQDASWGRFLSILACKAEEAGRRFVKVPPHGTSSTCFRCGTYRKKELSERVHSCPCGLVLDRDVHAALNILRLGRSLQGSIA
jgi:putative transposase